MGVEKFSETGPNFLNCVQYIFQGGAKNFAGGLLPFGYGPVYNSHKLLRSTVFFMQISKLCLLEQPEFTLWLKMSKNTLRDK